MTWGEPHRHVTICSSTNTLAADWFREEPLLPEGALVSSDCQTHGRGRRGRTWSASDSDSILMSVVLRPTDATSALSQLGFVASLAVIEALSVRGLICNTKWPNDVLVNDRKICGVLIETVNADDGLVAIVGVGINCHQNSFPTEHGFRLPPTSILMETGQVCNRQDLMLDVVNQIGYWETERRREHGWKTILNSWKQSLRIGSMLVRNDEAGTVVDVMPDGAAKVQLPDGTFIVWTSVDG